MNSEQESSEDCLFASILLPRSSTNLIYVHSSGTYLVVLVSYTRPRYFEIANDLRETRIMFQRSKAMKETAQKSSMSLTLHEDLNDGNKIGARPNQLESGVRLTSNTGNEYSKRALKFLKLMCSSLKKNQVNRVTFLKHLKEELFHSEIGVKFASIRK